jgi:hypothetical protein
MILVTNFVHHVRSSLRLFFWGFSSHFMLDATSTYT